jgi:hypothetical protein
MFHANYAKPLRTIGQALEALRVKDIDIESQGEDYLVRGKMESKLQQAVARQEQESKIRMIWGKLRGRRDENGDARSAPSFVPLELRYTSEDIERLEREGQARRHNPSGMPNSHSVSQILRTAGGYVENKRGRLVGVSCKDHAVTIQYEKSDGQTNIEEFTIISLYDYCVHMYMQRAGRS